jgi:Domain of unknown function (DUF5134)
VTGPSWLAALLAGVMLLIAAGSVVRLALWRWRGRAGEPEADVLHALMGVAMAGMLEPAVGPVPGLVWRVVFAMAAAWFGGQAIRARVRKRDAGRPAQEPGGWRSAHPAPHSVESVAMVYMLTPAGSAGHGAAMASMAMPGMAGAAPAANPAVAVVLALFLLGYIVWTADRMTSQSRSRSAPAGWAAPDAAAACSKIAMSLAMGYMLLTMV